MPDISTPHMLSNLPDTLSIGFSEKTDGDMTRTNVNRLSVLPARHQFLTRYGLSERPLSLIHPTHSPNVELYSADTTGLLQRSVYLTTPRIEADYDRFRDGSDGILTFDHQIAVGLISGDCLPLVVWDRNSTLHGIVHVGLLGALNKIVSGVARLASDAIGGIDSLMCYLGPSIGPQHYNLSSSGLWAAIRERALRECPDADAFREVRDGAEYFDLAGYVRRQLLDLGIAADNIDRHPGSTGDLNSLYFSHHTERGAASTRRFMSAIGFKE